MKIVQNDEEVFITMNRYELNEVTNGILMLRDNLRDGLCDDIMGSCETPAVINSLVKRVCSLCEMYGKLKGAIDNY